MDNCTHLNDFLNEQIMVLRRHINKHKYYQQIADVNQAELDFINKYSWVMREIYCDVACPNKKLCEVYQKYLITNSEVEV